MNENIDLTKILKYCPEGWKFYSSIYGDVTFRKIENGSEYPVKFSFINKNNSEKYSRVTEQGLHVNYCNGECTLFPSRDQRDWSKLTAPWYKKDNLVEPKFKVGDKIVNILMKYMVAPGTQSIISEITDDKYIFTDGSYLLISNQDNCELVSNKKPKFDPKMLKPFDRVIVKNKDEIWTCMLFSHIINSYDDYKYECCNLLYRFCIPYNDDTKHLVGTDEEAPEYYRYWED